MKKKNDAPIGRKAVKSLKYGDPLKPQNIEGAGGRLLKLKKKKKVQAGGRGTAGWVCGRNCQEGANVG